MVSRPLYRLLFLSFALAVYLFSSVPLASAMCPLCVIGAAAGLSVARYYGIDDIVVGLWLGALAVSTALWAKNVINKRMGKANIKKIPLQDVLVVAAVIAATILPFYFAGFFKGMPTMSDTIFGINRLVLGTIIGGAITFAGSPISNLIKKRRGAAFPYQTIILTLGILVGLSLLFWYATKYFYIV